MAIDRGEENLNNADQDVECTTNETIDVSDISSGVSGIDELDVEVSEWHENTQPDETEECSRMDCDDEVGKGEGDLTLGKASSCGGAKRASEKEPMQVYLRIRPLKEGEKGVSYEVNPSKTFIKVNPFATSSNKQGEFSFSHIFDGASAEKSGVGQKHLFDHTVRPLMQEFVGGLNCLVFTYGVTNSGKTYTLQGIPTDIGILPRALDVLFNSIGEDQLFKEVSPMPVYFDQFEDVSQAEVEKHDKLKQRLLNSSCRAVHSVLNQTMISGSSDRDVSMFCPSVNSTSVNSTAHSIQVTPRNSVLEDQSRARDQSSVPMTSVGRNSEDAGSNDVEEGKESRDSGFKGYAVWVSFLEIYNEQITDLLVAAVPSQGKGAATPKPNNLRLHESANGNVYVGELREIKVDSAQEACQILAAGQRNLRYCATAMNQRSSRSHCIFSIKLAKVCESGVRASLFSFCDLAGAERQSKTNTAGSSLKEAANINTSMMQLGLCLKQLREKRGANPGTLGDKENNKKFVNFRNSKLTYLFQNVLQGSGRAVMIVNIAPCLKVYEETLNTLKFAAVAQKVSTNAVMATEAPKVAGKKKISISKKCGLKRSSVMRINKDGVIEKVFKDSSRTNTDKTPRKPTSNAARKTPGATGGAKRQEVITEEEEEDETASEDEDENNGSEEDDEWYFEPLVWDKDKEVTEEITESDEEKIIPFPDYKRVAVDYLRLKEKYNQKKQRIEELEQEQWVLRNDHNKQIQRTYRKHDELLDDVLSRLESKDEKIKSLTADLEKGKEDYEQCKAELELLKAERNTQKEVPIPRNEESLLWHDKGDESDVKWSLKRVREEELEKRLFEADEVCAKLSEELEKVRTDKSVSEKEVNKLVQTLSVQSLDEILKVHEDLKRESDAVKEELKKLTADRCYNEELKKEIVLKDGQIEKMRLEIELKDGEIESTKKKMESKDEQIEYMQKEIELKDRMIEKYKTQIEELQKSLDGKTKQYEYMMDKCADLNKENSNLKQKRPRSSLPVLRKSMGAVSEVLREVDLNTTVDLGNVSRELNALLEMQPISKKQVTGKVLELESKLVEKKMEVDSMRQEMDESQVVVLKASQIISQSNVLTDLRESEMQANVKRIAELDVQLSNLKQELKQQKEEALSTKKSLEAELKRQEVELKQQKKQHEKDMSQLKVDNDSFSQQIQQLQKQNSDLISSLSRVSSTSSKGSSKASIAETKGQPLLNDSSMLPASAAAEVMSPTYSALLSRPGRDLESTGIGLGLKAISSKSRKELEKDSESETDEPPVKLLKGNGKKVGKRVAAMKKMFEPTEDKPKRMSTSRRGGRVAKRTSSGMSTTRTRRAAAKAKKALANVPEDSILDQNEESWEGDLKGDEDTESISAKKSRVSSGTCTTDSLDETKFDSTILQTSRITRSAKKLLDTSSVSSVAVSSAESSMASGRSGGRKRPVSRNTAAKKSLYNVVPSDSFDMSMDDQAQLNEMVEQVMPPRGRKGRPTRATRASKK